MHHRLGSYLQRMELFPRSEYYFFPPLLMPLVHFFFSVSVNQGETEGYAKVETADIGAER